MTNLIRRIPDKCSPDNAKHWLRESISTIGPGFHFDTPASNYVDDKGQPSLSTVDVARLDRGLTLAMTVLDHETFERVCLEEVWRLLGVRYDSESDLLVSVD